MTARRLSAAERVLLALGIIALVRAALGWFLPVPREDFVLFCLLLAVNPSGQRLRANCPAGGKALFAIGEAGCAGGELEMGPQSFVVLG